MENKPKVGLVGVASHFESGGERADSILSETTQHLENAGMDVVVSDVVVWDMADAINCVNKFNSHDIDALVVVDITWVLDSLKYIFVHELNVPIVFWAVPYTETFSIGCVQHFGSILTGRNIPYWYVYGLPNELDLVEKVKEVAIAGLIVKKVRNLRIGLLGPRQTWRVTGPQDMTTEEWDYSEHFGPTIVHVEMEELLNAMKEQSEEISDELVKDLADRHGKVLASDKTMERMMRAYLATKLLIDRYQLNVVAAECYPSFSGLMNVTASWLGVENTVIDTEGDIGHSMVQYMLNLASGGGAVALGEVGSFNDETNTLSVAHEGSSSPILASEVTKVQISPSGEEGAFVGVPVKTMNAVTVCNLTGINGKYKMLISSASTLEPTYDEWVEGGSKLLAKLRVNVTPSLYVQAMIENGLDHHLLIKEGNYVNIMKNVCRLLGVEVISL